MNPAVRLWVMLVAFIGSCALIHCTPAPVSADAGDGGGTFCERDCSRRFAIGCLEAEFAATCVSVCESAVRDHVFEACLACAPYVGANGKPHIRCNP